MADPGLYDLWVDLTRGNFEKPSNYIRSAFKAQYVISDLRHEDFIRQAEADGGMERVYQDREAVIYRVTGTE